MGQRLKQHPLSGARRASALSNAGTEFGVKESFLPEARALREESGGLGGTGSGVSAEQPSPWRLRSILALALPG